MSESRLTEAQIAIAEKVGDSTMQSMAAEIRQLRALLATPTDPPGMEQPEVVPLCDGTNAVAWDLDLEDCGDMQPIEAIGYGAALIRAALSARALAAKGGE